MSADRGRTAARRRRARRPRAADDAQPPEFHWFDLAAQFLRATPVSIYNSSSPEEIQYLASHAGAEIAIVEDAGLPRPAAEVRDELPRLKQIYVIDRPTTACPDGVAAGSELDERGQADLAALAARDRPADIATLIYTSGTTGPPKGVMISQYNVVYTVEQLRDASRSTTTRACGSCRTSRWRTSPSG